MLVNNFNFELQKSLIAQYPLSPRSSCRLLSLNGSTGIINHGMFHDILEHCTAGDLMVFNDTRVIAARIYGYLATGAKIQILVERILDHNRVLSRVKSSRILRVGEILFLGDDEIIRASILCYNKPFYEIIFEDNRSVLKLINKIGHLPLPPYIRRLQTKMDDELYQTIYSKKDGAIASPTAGLHFDKELLKKIIKKGVDITYITLHIASATFQPVRAKKIQQHIMHTEYVEVSQKTVNDILACKERGNKVIAVGTSSVRALESASYACKNTLIKKYYDNTKMFIFPGYHYKITDAMITNFHLPKSTLIMLVAAFASYEHTINAYRQAILEKYRFFSYGDAMYITPHPNSIKK